MRCILTKKYENATGNFLLLTEAAKVDGWPSKLLVTWLKLAICTQNQIFLRTTGKCVRCWTWKP